jgi:hypothetical protein
MQKVGDYCHQDASDRGGAIMTNVEEPILPSAIYKIDFTAIEPTLLREPHYRGICYLRSFHHLNGGAIETLSLAASLPNIWYLHVTASRDSEVTLSLI